MVKSRSPNVRAAINKTRDEIDQSKKLNLNDNLEKGTVRIHPDVIKAIENWGTKKRMKYSLALRMVLDAGMEALGITLD